MKIYTRTGDRGETGLFGGPRVAKDDPRIEAYGTVDELNAELGRIRAEAIPAEIDAALQRIQNQLFDVGAELATPEPESRGTNLLGDRQIAWIEEQIDAHQAELEPLKTFILPAGTRAAAELHVARCVCRRAERRLVTLRRDQRVSPLLLVYLNRLGDLLFVLGRHANAAAGVEDIPWEKGQ